MTLPNGSDIRSGSVMGRLMGVFRGAVIGNLLLLTAIIIGFFHGWMKLYSRSPLTAFAFDIPLTAAVIVTIMSIGQGKRVFPKSPVSGALQLLLVVCAVYSGVGMLFFGVPPVVSMASFRAWCFIPLIFLLGYHLTLSERQITLFVTLLLFLCVVTTIYGMRQSPEEIQKLMKQDPYLQYRLSGAFYGSKSGGHFRVFSTFVSSAGFGTTMAFGALFALSWMFSPGTSRRVQFVLMLVSGLLAYGVVISGARLALIMLAIGLAFTAWYRKSLLQVLVTPAIVAGAIWLATFLTKGATLERLSSLLDLKIVWFRVWIVLSPAWDYLQDHLLGGGIGRSGYGVPQVLANYAAGFEFKLIDGDVGRLVVDMGLVGLLVYSILLYVTSREGFRQLKDLRGTPLGRLALPCGAWFIIGSTTAPIGSPFLGIPVGPLTWFFAGALLKLHEQFKSSGGLLHAISAEGSMPVAYAGTTSTSMRKPAPPRALLTTDGTKTVRRAAGKLLTAVPDVANRRFLFRKKTEEKVSGWNATPPPPTGHERRNRRPRL